MSCLNLHISFRKLLLRITVLILFSSCNPSAVTINNKPTVKEPQSTQINPPSHNSGTTCSEENSDIKKKCRNQCFNIYEIQKDRQDCEQHLTANRIKKIYQFHRSLENPSKTDFESVSVQDFDAYLSTSTEALKQRIEDRNFSEADAKDFVLWLLRDRNIQNVFVKRDTDFKLLIALLDKFVSNFRANNPDHKIFTATIQTRNKLLEVVSSTNSETFFNHLFKYFENNNFTCDNGSFASTTCFRIWCNIGRNVSVATLNKILDFNSFEFYIDTIIKNKVNQSNWSSDLFKSTNDLTNWVSNLCR